MGKGGPLLVLKLLLPGLVVDLGARLPLAPAPRAALVGALAGASGFFPSAAVEALAGAPADLVPQHARVSAVGEAAFGALGGSRHRPAARGSRPRPRRPVRRAGDAPALNSRSRIRAGVWEPAGRLRPPFANR